MKIVHAFFIIVFSLWVVGVSLGGRESDQTVHVRVVAYNVEFGRSTTPEQVGKMFKPYNLDIIGFNEVPDGDWTCLLYTSPSPRDYAASRMPSSA